MFGLLRFIRGFFGFLFAMQVFGLLGIISWLSQPDAVTSAMIGQVFFKGIALLLFGWLFFYFRNLINQLHTERYGEPHPALAVNNWAL